MRPSPPRPTRTRLAARCAPWRQRLRRPCSLRRNRTTVSVNAFGAHLRSRLCNRPGDLDLFFQRGTTPASLTSSMRSPRQFPAAMVVALVALVALDCDTKPSPCAPCSPPASASAATRPVGSAMAPASAAGGSGAAATDDHPCYPWCEPGEASYGSWTATPEEVLSAARKLPSECAPSEWFVQAVGDCMQRLNQSNVKVMAGVMDGDRYTKRACVISTSSAQWQDRRFIVFTSDVREDAAFFAFSSAFELKRSGPVQVTRQCQNSPTAATGPAGRRLQPANWKMLPADLQARLCVP